MVSPGRGFSRKRLDRDGAPAAYAFDKGLELFCAFRVHQQGAYTGRVPSRDDPPNSVMGSAVAGRLARCLEKALAAMGFKAKAHVDLQPDRLFTYVAELLRWNERINLTGARSPEAVIEEHLPDSFALAEVIPVDSRPYKVVDIGSGGGLPAIPLALLRSDLQLLLVEPRGKRVAFLRSAVRTLGIGDRVRVFAGRDDGLERQRFDFAVSKATFAPEQWLIRGQNLVRAGGQVAVLHNDAAHEGRGSFEVDAGLGQIQQALEPKEGPESGRVEQVASQGGLTRSTVRPYTLIDGRARVLTVWQRST